MEKFIYKVPYREDGRIVLEVNILPSTYCTFNCIYCPIDRREKRVQTDQIQPMGDISGALKDLEQRIDDSQADLVFINSHGESVVHDGLPAIIDTIHRKGVPVRLLSNGYPLASPVYQALANQCEEVISELKNSNEEAFQKTQRPIKGYTLEQYVENLKAFRRQYHGRYIFEVTIVKGYNDDTESARFLKSVVRDLQPDELSVIPIDEPFQKVLGVDDDTLQRIRGELASVLKKS
jgi:wyosine [tRNA(Phe)-imidazoG37] synthetase (radical SAM superfamily)